MMMAKQLTKHCLVEGRRPEGLVIPTPPETAAASPLGDWFATACAADAASALAYERLHRELVALRAPEHLVAQCRRAHFAEQRHAAAFAALAKRFGAQVLWPQPPPGGLPLRSLADIAMANARDGVVRTTYGAAAARFRARFAQDSEIREVMLQIAEDECEHAEFALALAEWLSARLDPVECVWVESALRNAVQSLAEELDGNPSPGLDAAGVPTRNDALVIWSSLSRAVWHPAFDVVWKHAA
jgi:hypothetical protein